MKNRIFFKTDMVDIRDGRGDPNMVRYRHNSDLFFVRRNKKNARNSLENEDSFLALTIKYSNMNDRKPVGFVIYLKGHNGGVPRACEDHLTNYTF